MGAGVILPRAAQGGATNLTQDPEALDAALVETAIVPGLLRQLHRSYVYDTKEEYLVASLHNLAFMQDRNKVPLPPPP